MTDKMTKAKVKLIQEFPFFGAIAMKFPIIEAAPGHGAGTMHTDGTRIYYDNDFVNGMTVPETCGVLAHEAMHIGLLHTYRRQDRHPMIWNIACDYAINQILIDAGATLPEGALLDEQFKGMTAETIYDNIKDQVKIVNVHIVCPDGSESTGEKVEGPHQPQGWGEFEDSPNAGDPRISKQEQDEIKSTVIAAANAAKKKGKMPSGFEGLLESFRRPKVNWIEFLRNFVSGNTPDDFSYRKLQTLYAAMCHSVVPNLDFHGPGTIVIGIDSSGSVSNKEASQFISEVASIHNEMMPQDTYVVWCDAAIQHVDHYTQGEVFDDKRRHGCGGTMLRPVFDWVRENGIIPDSFIFLTDLEIWDDDLAGLDIDYPVLWVSTGRETAPFGQVIKITV